jgi:hypothetical protein
MCPEERRTNRCDFPAVVEKGRKVEFEQFLRLFSAVVILPEISF